MTKHASLQTALRDAGEAVQLIRNSSVGCEAKQREYAVSMTAARMKEEELQLRLEQLTEENNWLNLTVNARDTSLKAERAQRIQAESSVQGLKEQMNLIQGQLLTAQQQQVNLHKKKHH